MAESLILEGNTREEHYISLLPRIKALAKDEAGLQAVLGNIMSALKYGMGFYWVGVYHADKRKNLLELGPFQGTLACTRIAFGKGVCGTAWKSKQTIIVNDVSKFEGHIACSSESKSEIVLPVLGKDGEVEMILDIDSEYLSHFSETDEKYLKQVVKIIEETAMGK